MKQFQFEVRDPLGIHARPAGVLVKLAKSYTDTDIVIQKGQKEARLTQLMRLMGLGIKCGDEVTVRVEGGDEEAAITGIKSFFEENL